MSIPAPKPIGPETHDLKLKALFRPFVKLTKFTVLLLRVKNHPMDGHPY
jgi:hypothetical protein